MPSGAYADIILALTYANPKNNVAEKVYDGTTGENAVAQTAGFRPATDWVKMGYIPSDQQWSTDGYRDYNNDGVRDQWKDPCNIPTFDPKEKKDWHNVLTGRATRYADLCLSMESAQ